MMNNDKLVMGVCWYREEQWDRLKEIVSDPELFEDNYSQWRTDAEKSMNELRSMGHHPKKVLIDANAMQKWVNEQNRILDASARTEYVTFLLRERDVK